MPSSYVYPDAFLRRHIDTELEARAIAAVTGTATAAGVTFASAWTEQLVIVQAYVIAAMENQSEADDLYGVKLKNYSALLGRLTTQAINAANAESETISNIGFMSIPLERA